MFRWYAAMRPHAGLTVTGALILAAGLLYWLTFGEKQPTHATTAGHAAPGWSMNATTGASLSQLSEPLPLDLSGDGILPFAWAVDAPPNVEITTEAAPLPLTMEPADAEATVEAQDAVATAIDSTAPPASVTPEATAPAAVVQVGPLSVGLPTIVYPTTPYAAFDFGPALHGALAPQVSITAPPAVAEIPADFTDASGAQPPR
jgi:hypothetical protein